MDKNNSYWKRWLMAFLFGVALITVYKTFDNLSGFFSALGGLISLFTPFIIGIVLAFFLYPATNKLDKKLLDSKRLWLRKRHTSISTLVVYLSFIAILVIAFSVIIPRLSVSLADFVKKLPEYVKDIDHFTDELSKEGGFLHRLHLDSILETLNMQKLLQNIFMQDVWIYLESFKGVTDVLMNWLLGIVICAYILLERSSLLKIFKTIFSRFFKKKTMVNVSKYVKKISDIFYQFFFGKAIDSLIIGVIAIIVFSLMHVPYAALMGVIVMVFNMIPYFGPFIGAVPVVLVTLLADGFYPAIWVTVFIFALQQFDGLWLGPKILGDSVGVSPFWVIFAIIVFGGLFGIWGMIFGVPLVAAIRLLALDYFDDGKMNLSSTAEKIQESNEEH